MWTQIPAVATCIAALGCLPAQSSAQPVGSLAFARDFGWGDTRVFVCGMDGGAERELPHFAEIVNHPRWSPDGQWLAVHAGPVGSADIWLMRPDLSGYYQPVTSGLGDVVEPEWSHSGMHIAFRRGLDVLTVRPDGSGLVDHGGPMVVPIWGAQADSLLFSDWEGSFPADLHRYDLISRELVEQVSDADSSEAYGRGVESPDGTKVLAVRWYSSSADFDLVLIDPAEGVVVNLTADMPGRADYGVWAQDGSWIVFASDCDGTWDIWAMRQDGSDKVKLHCSTDDHDEHSPDIWQPTFCEADFNHDGIINTLDFIAYLNAWSTGCP